MNGKPFAKCAVCEAALASTKDTQIVARSKTPKGAEDLAAELHGAKVCGNCAGELKKSGFSIFNLAQSIERRKEKEAQASQSTIRQLLEAKGKAALVPASA